MTAETRLTKRKDDGSWRVVVNGRDTPVCIIKGRAPRYREPQMWFVCVGADFLFEAPGLDAAMAKLSTLARVLA
jgi:hypothetical protein